MSAFLRVPSFGLAPRLVAFAVLFAALGGASVAVSVISTARTALRDHILNTHLVMADMMAGQIEEYVGDVEADAVELSSRPEFLSAYQAHDYEGLKHDLEIWLSQREERVDCLGVYGADATIIAAARPLQPTTSADVSINSGIVRRVIESGAVARGRPVRSRRTGNPVIPVFVPLRTPAGQVYGVLTETLSLGSLSDSLLKDKTDPSSRISVIENSTGVILVNTDPARVLSTDVAGRAEASSRARTGERGTVEGTRSNGEATLAAFAPVPRLSWSVLLQEDASRAFAPIESMTRQALLFGGATVVLAALIAALAAVSLVRPLRALRATAERMASGDLARRAGVRRGGEIGDLGHAFDRMAEQLQDSVEELTRRAHTDTLTSLPNRALLRQRLEEALAGGGKVALMIMDLDRFKEINDTLGHSSGDGLLRALATRLENGVRRSDTVARLGGDEFAILLPGSSKAQARAVADSLLRLVSEPFDLGGRQASVGASIGVATAPDQAADADTLLCFADAAMYVAKHTGQGVAIFTPEEPSFERRNRGMFPFDRAA